VRAAGRSALAARGAAFARRWGVSLASLASGALTLAVFRRGLPHVGWIVGYLVALWLLYVVLAQARERLQARGRGRVVWVGDYTVQTLCHGLLLFVLPGYLASTTPDGPTAPFLLALGAAALLTTIDPWYRALVHPRPWLGRALFAYALFAGWNVALPLVGLPPGWARLAAAGAAGLALVPTLARPGAGWLAVAALAGAAPAAAAALAWLLTAAIPPAPLHLVGPTVARGVADREPVAPLATVTRADLEGGLVAWTPIAAPPGLEQPVTHRWRHEGGGVTTIALPTPVRGGRSTGFRTYSRKADFPADPTGRWTVDVLTASGQLIGRLRFQVAP
jgi:hypothetical protein